MRKVSEKNVAQGEKWRRRGREQGRRCNRGLPKVEKGRFEGARESGRTSVIE